MVESNSNLFWQLKKRQEQEDLLLLSLDPTLSIPSVYSNFQPSVPNNSTKKSYNWSYRYFSYRQDSLIPLNPDSLNYSDGRILFQEFPSENGNLTISNIPGQTVNVFSANIFKYGAGTTSVSLNWSGGISLYLNSGIIIKSDYTPFTSSSIPLNFSSGWNNLQIFLYSLDSSQSFSLNSDIGLFADIWETPSYTEPETPQNVSIAVDLNSSTYKDGNSTILRWDSTDPNKTLGYNIYRTGPYNSGLSIPSLASNSGYFTSGANGINLGNRVREAYYTVSSYNGNGESLPTQSFKVSLKPTFSGVSFTSGISSGILGGSLAPGAYSYIISATNPIGNKFPVGPVIAEFILNTGNCSVIYWSGTQNVDNYKIYRFSGVLINSVETVPLLTGNLIATLSNNQNTFVDSGFITPSITGITELISDWVDLANFSFSNSNYKNNSSYISWSGISNASGYKIYRTFYSGNYDRNSLVGDTTSLFFIDSGITPSQGKPTLSENITSLNYGTKKYKDQGVIGNQTYKYSISSYNYSLNESIPTSGFQVTVGDPFAPATPSGITITSFNGFTTLGWLNGTENDLAGTNVYRSDDNITYNILGTTVGTTFSTFIGYSGTPWFKLSNFDTSDNESALSAAHQGSGVFVTENIILKNFKILSSLDTDLDYYLPSGTLSDVPKSRNIFPFRGKLKFMETLPDQASWWNKFYGAFSNINSGLRNTTLFLPPPDGFTNTVWHSNTMLNVKDFDHIFVRDPDNFGPPFFGPSTSMISAYYSGTTGELWTQTVSTTSTNSLGPERYSVFITGNLLPQSDNLAQTIIDCPVLISKDTTYDDYIRDRNMLIFWSGNNIYPAPGAGNSIGFVSLNRSGLVNGNIRSYEGSELSYNVEQGLNAVYDNNNNIQVFAPNENGIGWYKFAYTTGVAGGLSLLASITGLFTQNFTSARSFVDRDNETHVFLSKTPDIEKVIYYSKIDSSGNISFGPNQFFEPNFRFDVWNVAFSTGLNYGYLNFSFPTGVFDKGGAGMNQYFTSKYTTYGYRPGSYRKRLVIDDLQNPSLYQVLQSIIK